MTDGSTLSIDEESKLLREMMEEMVTYIPTKWFEFGLLVNIPDYELNQYETGVLTHRTAFSRVLGTWRQMQPDLPPFKWETAIGVLMSNSLKEINLAHRLAKKFLNEQ